MQNHPPDCDSLVAFAIVSGTFLCPIWPFHGHSMLLYWVWAKTLSGKLIPACLLLCRACLNLNLLLPGHFPEICEDNLPLLFRNTLTLLSSLVSDLTLIAAMMTSVPYGAQTSSDVNGLSFSPCTHFPTIFLPHYIFFLLGLFSASSSTVYSGTWSSASTSFCPLCCY